jgi:alpha-tubulin suppressor-like RCC1 family protein
MVRVSGTGRISGSATFRMLSEGNGGGGENGGGDGNDVSFQNLISLGENNSIAITSSGLYKWGAFLDGGDMGNATSPTLLTASPSFAFVNFNAYNAFSGKNALTANGERWTWLGQAAPTQADEEYRWSNFARSDGPLEMGVQTDGTLWAFSGFDMSGASGIEGGYSGGFVRAGTDTDWKQVALDGFGANSYALKQDGRLFGAGFNYTDFENPLHVQIGNDSDWKTISVFGQGNHQLALKNNGTLWVWGQNQAGQLGTGNTDSVASPTQIQSGQTWKSIAAGTGRSFAVRSDGTLWAWGSNEIDFEVYGALGTGSTASENLLTPTQIGADTDWSHVVTGNNHAVAVKQDGSVYAWGGNSNGQLGLGDTTNRTSPTLIAGLNLLAA